MKGDYIFDAVCESFLNPPTICDPFASESQIFEEPATFTELLLWILALLLIFFVVFYFCYRRKIKRDLTKEMSIQINTAVSHYFKMNDKSIDEPNEKKLIEAQYV